MMKKTVNSTLPAYTSPTCRFLKLETTSAILQDSGNVAGYGRRGEAGQDGIWTDDEYDL